MQCPFKYTETSYLLGLLEVGVEEDFISFNLAAFLTVDEDELDELLGRF